MRLNHQTFVGAYSSLTKCKCSWLVLQPRLPYSNCQDRVSSAHLQKRKSNLPPLSQYLILSRKPFFPHSEPPAPFILSSLSRRSPTLTLKLPSPFPQHRPLGALVALDCIGVIRGWRYEWVFSRRFFADTDVRAGCLITMPIWEEPCSEPSTTLTILEFGTFSGPSTRCLTNPPLSQNHNQPPFPGDEVDFPTDP